MTAARLAVSALVAVAILALLALTAGGRLLVDALWFQQLGYFVVFRTVLQTKVAVFLLGLLIAFPWIAGFGLAAIQERRGQVRVVLRREGNGAATIPELIAPIADRIPWRGLVGAASALLALFFAFGQAAAWETYLLWWRGGPFGATDPIFGRDIGFYLFAVPAYRTLVGGALAAVVLAALVAGAVFWLQGALDLRRSGGAIPEAALSLLSAVLAAAFLVKAFDYWLGRYELLLEPGGTVFGAGYTSANLRMPLQ
ncbi:MAG: UPF0182 family protein, partial [Candidatus Binatia bacterium]